MNLNDYLIIVIGLLKFLLILTVGTYLFRLISPFILKYLIHRLKKKFNDSNPENPQPSPKKEPKKTDKEMGEYIDYEEID
ncbi:MAG: Uncharacterised protein [Flavobacteriaceae bacterium]|nr:MAG: Uncharacterised protein [Flavobacteriaceae bacterium]